MNIPRSEDRAVPAEGMPNALSPDRYAWMRLDTAGILKRFFFLEQALTISAAAWIPALRRLESKAAMARVVWQNALTANALRERVFELKYPLRLITEGADAPLISAFRASLHAPNGAALALALARVFNPLVRDAYAAYLEHSDPIADGPSHRFLHLAFEEKGEQTRILERLAIDETGDGSGAAPEVAERWCNELAKLVESLGGISQLEVPGDRSVPEVVSPGRRFELAEVAGRDDRYRLCSFYWPDILDSSYPYGEGKALRIRSAVSHINEVWAVDTAAAILYQLSGVLGWEFVHDAARWLYDESRHMTMGQVRLQWWNLSPELIPLGAYIYEACRGQDPIYRLGMLGYFETKNIGKKQERARAFHEMGDVESELHMDFDWADETLHAEYGRRWLKQLLQQRGRAEDEWREILNDCEELVQRRVAAATEQDRTEIRRVADKLLEVAGANLQL